MEWFQPFMKKVRITVLSAPTIPFLPKYCFSIISFHFLTKLLVKQVRLDLYLYFFEKDHDNHFAFMSLFRIYTAHSSGRVQYQRYFRNSGISQSLREDFLFPFDGMRR